MAATAYILQPRSLRPMPTMKDWANLLQEATSGLLQVLLL